jgi:hypothetical protein
LPFPLDADDRGRKKRPRILRLIFLKSLLRRWRRQLVQKYKLYFDGFQYGGAMLRCTINIQYRVKV